MANIAIFRINYKSDFILTLNSDAGWMTPFCIKFWTGAPSQAYFVGYDGETYTHCAPVAGDPTKLEVQFDDHHLPIGDLKFQIGYHFTVADFPTTVEDEVINQAAVIIDQDGTPMQVMLDLNGETAPEIQFSLPAYANEAQRIANEEQRIAHEATRIVNEESRIVAETIRQQNETQRINNEAQRIRNEDARIAEFAQMKDEAIEATDAANSAAALANEKAALAADKAALAGSAATLANAKAQLAADKAALAQAAATLANDKAALAQQKAEYAQQQGGYAKDQGDYAKNQGDYAKEQGDTALADHQRAEADHGIAVDDHTQAGNDHTRAESDHGIAVDDHTQAGNDHTRAESDHGIAVDDHTQAGNDHTRAESDHGIAADDHTQAGNDHTRAESDHTRAESDHDAVELYVDSLGVFDLSKHNAVGGVLATYADLSAALTALNALDSQYKYGGMSFKFVQTSDNKYVQYRLMKQTWSVDINDWSLLTEDIELYSNIFIRVVLDKKERILYGVKLNGDFYFGGGIPSIIQSALVDLDKKLVSEIDILATNKVDKVDGKSLIDSDFADGIIIVDSSEIVDVKLDREDRIIELTKKDGAKVFYSDLDVKGNIFSEPIDFELDKDNNFVSVEIDAKDRIIRGKLKSGENFPKEEDESFLPLYPKLFDAMRDDCYKPFLLGSQLVQANTSLYDKNLGQQNTFKADKLIKQFNYIGMNGKLPNMKTGYLQKIMIGNVQATILYMGTYIYAITDGDGMVYRMPYSKLPIITENNTEIDAINISLDNMLIDGVYETNDGNFLIQVYDSTSSDTYPTRSLYKVTLDDELNATVSENPVIVCVQSTTNIVGVREHWSFKQYGEKILVSPYGSGRTGQVWMSDDYGNSFECIFNIANDSTYVATKPNGQGGYGAYGIHPLPSQMLPPQGDDFWNNVSSIGNGSRHIHSLCYDEEFERIWLVTGDDKYLATGIYWSDDFGKTWHRKSLVFNYPDIDCGTTTQMLQVVSMKNCVLFGTDGWGNGIFRYNRGKKEDEPIIEFVFGWDADRDNLYGIASHNIITSNGIMLMVFASNSDAALPRGGVVASDGYHFRKIFIDTYADGVTLASQKIGWPSFLSVNNDNLYIRTKAKNEIILIEKYNK